MPADIPAGAADRCKTLLVLGGTAEASALAAALRAAHSPDRLRLIVSLAGRTAPETAPQAFETRRGGFGGAAGLIAYLRRERVDALLDASHPFAARISAHAHTACAALGLPCLRLERPPWPSEPSWMHAPDLQAAARRLQALPVATRALLTVGAGGLAAFRAVRKAALFARVIEPPDPAHLPPGCQVIRARGPFTLEQEQALLRALQVDVLVTRNSGGRAVAPKLQAARERGVAVLMIDRPPAQEGLVVSDAPAALAWVDRALAIRTATAAPPAPR